jgi:hypothetical protein
MSHPNSATRFRPDRPRGGKETERGFLIALIALIALIVAALWWAARDGALGLIKSLVSLALGLCLGALIRLYERRLAAPRKNGVAMVDTAPGPPAKDDEKKAEQPPFSDGRTMWSLIANQGKRLDRLERDAEVKLQELASPAQALQRQMQALPGQVPPLPDKVQALDQQVVRMQNELAELHAEGRVRLEIEFAKARGDLRDLEQRNNQGLDARQTKALQVLLDLERLPPESKSKSMWLFSGTKRIMEKINARDDFREVKALNMGRSQVEQLNEQIRRLQEKLERDEIKFGECALQLEAIRKQVRELGIQLGARTLDLTAASAGLASVREAILKEIEIGYLGIIDGRSPSADPVPLKEFLKQLDFQLIEIKPGSTKYDSGVHESVQSERDPNYEPGVILGVIKMGTIDLVSNTISRAQVVVNS